MSLATVRLWGAQIGYLAWNQQLDCASFEYDRDFQRSGIELSPVTLPLSSRIFRFASLNRETFHGLPGMLADALPDKFGNALIDQWLAETGRSPASFNPVERLCYVGKRGMGALEFEPSLDREIPADMTVNINELVELASTVLHRKQAQQFSLFADDERRTIAGLSKILAVGTSAGGARAKAIIAWNESTGDVRSGQIEAGDGYSYWLLKFDGVAGNRDKEIADPLGYGRIEYAYHLMAVAAGIHMTKCRLLEENGRAHFMTQRFDRSDSGQKLHMQSLCALGHHDFNSPGATSYEQAFLMCKQLGLGMADKEQLFLRMVFNVLAYNRDDHTKQIAFLMDKQGRWRLSPAYDVTFAYNPQGQFTSRHQMTVNRKREAITADDFLAVAKRQGLNSSAAKRMVERVQDSIADWPVFADKAGVNANHKTRINSLIRAG